MQTIINLTDKELGKDNIFNIDAKTKDKLNKYLEINNKMAKCCGEELEEVILNNCDKFLKELVNYVNNNSIDGYVAIVIDVPVYITKELISLSDMYLRQDVDLLTKKEKEFRKRLLNNDLVSPVYYKGELIDFISIIN